jgi:hypothetical protein
MRPTRDRVPTHTWDSEYLLELNPFFDSDHLLLHMGRPRKYFTAAEHATALRARREKYSQSERYVSMALSDYIF